MYLGKVYLLLGQIEDSSKCHELILTRASIILNY